MRIISWDIGEINLAYCILENENIIEWDKIDLLEDIRLPKYLCTASLKSGKKCNKKALFYNEAGYYCKLHANKISDVNKILEYELCGAINKNGKKCLKKAMYYETINNVKVYYCNKHKKNTEEIKKYINSKNISFFDKSVLMIKKLNKYENILDVDKVIIENQPVYKNPIMKSIQMILYTYYLLNGVINSNRINDVCFQNANKKLLVYDGPEITCDKKKIYDRNKYLSKEYCKYYLDNQWLDYFNNHKKKDDLADAYLQGLYFIKNTQTHI